MAALRAVTAVDGLSAPRAHRMSACTGWWAGGAAGTL
jgi:hypothetical protein